MKGMFRKNPIELIVPPAAKSDPKAKELIRIWAAHGKQHVTIAADSWEDPATWGLMLVDLAQHLANYYSHEKGMNKQDALARIKVGFEVEWNSSTSEAVGGVLK